MKKHAADTIGATIISAALIASLSPMAAFGAPAHAGASQGASHVSTGRSAASHAERPHDMTINARCAAKYKAYFAKANSGHAVSVVEA